MTNPLPKISIITPVLNVGNSIEKTLISVCHQSYSDVEHVIIDGGSTDETLAIVGKYQKKFGHIKLVSEADSGVYQAMNKGLDLCTGDWICFLGAADEFHHDTLLAELLDEGCFTEEQVVYGNVVVKGDAGWAKDQHVYDGRFDISKLLKKNICHQAIFYPRSVIFRVGYYNEKYYVTADWDYNIHCWALYKFHYTDKIIAFFQSGGVSSRGGDREFAADKPGNIVRYFDLDTSSSVYDDPASPFHEVVARLREQGSREVG